MEVQWRRVILASMDILASIGAVYLAFVIRFGLDERDFPYAYLLIYLKALPFILPVRLLVYFLSGLYDRAWSYASVPELLRIAFAVTVESTVAAVIILTMAQGGFPRSVIVISWLLTIAALGQIRLALRIRREWYATRGKASLAVHPTLIFGAGDAGAMLAREYAKHPEIGCAVVGFIDDNPQKKGLFIASKPVLGTRSDLERLIRMHKVTHLVIAMPSVKGAVVRDVMERARRLGLQVKTLPGLYELMNGTVSVNQIRDVQIEDLLGRPEVKVDLEAIAAYLSGEAVLVTGAGGSIGSELCRQVARFGPRQLLLLGHGENSIYEIDLELRARHPNLPIHPIIANIQDEARVRQVFERYRPSVVFHAAAHKHVPLMEANPAEAIKNNVFGTLNVARAADFYKAKRFVLISSDKAVNPTSVMGATKRAAEYVVQSLARTSKTVFVAVRFGNVLGSRGSVIPLFRKQIADGGPVTITDPKMVRYFMTIPEAVQLVIQASSMGKGGEVFVLDMGSPVRIVDLARDLIRLSGLEPGVDIEIAVTGMRPGEKLYEELLTAEEGIHVTEHERIYVARPDLIPPVALQGFLEELREVAASSQTSNHQLRNLIVDLTEKVAYHDAVGAGS
ncbi:MAG: polysaccharide biosynthesis protein [Bacillota bacterium]